jgi:peptidoglycan/xylan/chitin deacetylase (PgdA/CDA1 family)
MSSVVSSRPSRGAPLRLARLSAFTLLAAVAGACSDTGVLEPTSPSSAPTSASHHLTPAGGAVCGDATVAPLRVVTVQSFFGRGEKGQTIGSVTVNNVRDHLHVVYTVDAGWELATTSAIVVAKPGDMARRTGRDTRHMPNYRSHAAGTRTYEYDIMLADLGIGSDGKLVVVPMAEVHETSRRGASKVPATAGNTSIRVGSFELSYLSYKVQACAPSTTPTPPPGGGGTRAGAVTITFDDGYRSQHDNAFPIMKKYGLVGNLAVNSRPVDEGWPDYMTLPMVKALHKAGWAVVNHTWDHKDLATIASDAEQEAEISRNRDWIEKNGFRGAWIFVVPFHSWGKSTLSFAKEYSEATRGYSAQQLRTPQQWTPQTDFLQSWPPQDPYKLTGDEPLAPGVDIETAKQELRVYLERARTEGKFVDVFFHRVDPDRVADFEAVVKILAEYKALVRPYDALVRSNGSTVLVSR